MKITKKLLMLLSIAVCIGISSCSNDDDDSSGGGNPSVIDVKVENGNEYNDWIATVKALIVEDEGRYSDGGYYWIGYEVASCEYKNGGFKLNLPSSIPSQYLEPWYDEDDEDYNYIHVSDKNAKVQNIWILAYNEQGREIGCFSLEGSNANFDVETWYIYADRNFTVKGTVEDDEDKFVCDLSFKKGWNIIYDKDIEDVGNTISTSKPSGVTLKWYFEEY